MYEPIIKKIRKSCFYVGYYVLMSPIFIWLNQINHTIIYIEMLKFYGVLFMLVLGFELTLVGTIFGIQKFWYEVFTIPPMIYWHGVRKFLFFII